MGRGLSFAHATRRRAAESRDPSRAKTFNLASVPAATGRTMRRILKEHWPMIVALALATAIGWLVFTVLRPPPPPRVSVGLAGDASTDGRSTHRKAF